MNYLNLLVELFQFNDLQKYVKNVESSVNKSKIFISLLILVILCYLNALLLLVGEFFSTSQSLDSLAGLLFFLSIIFIVIGVPIFLVILLSYSIFGLFFYNLFLKKQLNYISILFHITYSLIALSLFHLVFMILYMPFEGIFQELNILIIPNLFYLLLTLFLIYSVYILALIIKKQTQLSFKGVLPYLFHIILLLLIALVYVQDSMNLYILLRNIF